MQACTNMNEHSSRSHMMLTVYLQSQNLMTGVTSRGKLNLVRRFIAAVVRWLCAGGLGWFRAHQQVRRRGHCVEGGAKHQQVVVCTWWCDCCTSGETEPRPVPQLHTDLSPPGTHPFSSPAAPIRASPRIPCPKTPKHWCLFVWVQCCTTPKKPSAHWILRLV